VPHRLLLGFAIPHCVMLGWDVACTTLCGMSTYVLAQATTPGEVKGGLLGVVVTLGLFAVGKYFERKGKQDERDAILEERAYKRTIAEQQGQLDDQQRQLDAMKVQMASARAKMGSNEGKAEGSLALLADSGIRPSPPPEGSAPAGTKYPLAMVVEDDPTSAQQLSKWLVKAGFQVMHTAIAADAIDLLDAVPAFVLLDLNLPGGSGVAVLEAIRARGLKSRVFVMTGSADEATLARVRALRPEDVWTRPLDLNAIVRVMKSPAPAEVAP
jgi:two-component system phosphate regulon response regulator PhoB